MASVLKEVLKVAWRFIKKYGVKVWNAVVEYVKKNWEKVLQWILEWGIIEAIEYIIEHFI